MELNTNSTSSLLYISLHCCFSIMCIYLIPTPKVTFSFLYYARFFRFFFSLCLLLCIVSAASSTVAWSPRVWLNCRIEVYLSPWVFFFLFPVSLLRRTRCSRSRELCRRTSAVSRPRWPSGNYSFVLSHISCPPSSLWVKYRSIHLSDL